MESETEVGSTKAWLHMSARPVMTSVSMVSMLGVDGLRGTTFLGKCAVLWFPRTSRCSRARDQSMAVSNTLSARTRCDCEVEEYARNSMSNCRTGGGTVQWVWSGTPERNKSQGRQGSR